MPWSAGDAKKHKKGLSSSQAKKWASVANGVLKTCLSEGKGQSECEGRAIRIANTMSVKGGRRAK